jgi:hypothetical protein
VPNVEAVEQLPIREWIRETGELNEAELTTGISFDEALGKLRTMCLVLPDTCRSREAAKDGSPDRQVGDSVTG